MNVGALNIRFAEVNGTKENCCVQDLRKQKEPKPEISDFDSFFFCLMFSVTIFRPLTFARNYATIADRKSKFGRSSLQAYSEIIVREKAYEPRYFIGVRMLIVWRRRRDSNSCYLYGTTPLAGELYFCLSAQNIDCNPVYFHMILWFKNVLRLSIVYKLSIATAKKLFYG